MSFALEIALDRDADVPVGTQLAWALRALILAGTLAGGDRLPALHRLAADAGVNANTVRAVYQRLEHDGLVTTRHGSGTFVTAGGKTADRNALARVAADATRAAREAGVDPRELAATLYVGGETVRRAARRSDSEAATRRRLRAQIAALEHALSNLTARSASRSAPAAARPSRPRLLSAAELAEQRDELLRRLADAHVAVS
ncbi:MAG TPA: GntR family transcriptional regulator [Conexibacter sp.]|nr:GntR family transcriptional regulator [Conexibacter sp.]